MNGLLDYWIFILTVHPQEIQPSIFRGKVIALR